ncbi:MAG: hydroxymethylglutaryl-CoA lyase, partial [Bacteroidota bacterium]
MIKITECPRDAMQGIKQLIPAELKAKYINQLLKVGFETIDFGSFVSPKAIPQMHDTAEVLEMLDLSAGNTKLLSI